MKSLSYLNKYFHKYRWRLISGFLFMIILNYFGSLMPRVLGDGVQYLIQSASSNTPGKVVLWTAIGFAGLYMLFSLIKGFFLFLTRQTIIVMSRYIEYDLKNEIYDKYQRLHYNFYKSQSTGDLMNRISEDVAQVRQYLGPGVMYTVNLIILFPFVCYQMADISWQLTLYCLIPLPIMALLIYKVSSRMNRLSKEVQEEQSMLSTVAQESFSGIRIIKAYIQERQTRERFNKSSEEYRRRNMKLVLVNALFMPTIMFLIGTSTLLAIYIGGLLTFAQTPTGNPVMVPGNIVTFIGYVTMLTWPFASVGWVTSIIQRAKASQQRINEFLFVKDEVQNSVHTPNEALEQIKFENVSFRYPKSTENVLNNLSFTIKRGETIGIVGRTGSGKSTLTTLLLRQTDASTGTIYYNNTPLREINLHAFREATGVVPQDVFLFSESIRENIAFGNSEASDEMIIQSARDAHVLHNIEEFPGRFNTLLGERGVNLSGGQKQRISIARALIRKPQLLVLDDCLSAVDTETEEVILRNLQRYTNEHQTTTIIVSHRVSSLRNANKILVLDGGSIVESGTHESLLAAGGVYLKMYEKQLLEQEL